MRSSLTTVLSPCVRRWVSYSPVVLSGHNKVEYPLSFCLYSDKELQWSKIKERKGAADKKKSDVYGRAGRVRSYFQFSLLENFIEFIEGYCYCCTQYDL